MEYYFLLHVKNYTKKWNEQTKGNDKETKKIDRELVNSQFVGLVARRND